MKLSERRAHFRVGLSPLYLPIYDEMCKTMPLSWQPYYGLRTIAEQDALYAQGRTVLGAVVTDAQGGESAHNYGCASDWTYWKGDGTPLWLSSNDPRWSEFAMYLAKAGGDWGGNFPSKDCPHAQLGLKIKWKDIGQILLAQGMEAAIIKIQENMR